MKKTLLDADYITREEKAVVRLFYKTEEGREIQEVADFRPYMYVLPEEHDLKKLQREIKELKNVTNVEIKRMIEGDREVEVLKVMVNQPRDVPNLRGLIKELEGCKEVREAHIPFAERYLIDSGLIPMQDCENFDLRIAAFDMEVYNPRGEPKVDQ